MTRDQFIYALTACGCLLRDDKTWYEHNELIKCFENLGLFEQETKNCSDCEIVQACVEAGIRSTSRTLSILDKIRAEIKSKIVKRPWLDFEDRERDRNDAFLEVLDIIDKYKTESEQT